MPGSEHTPLTILGIYPHAAFWSMGEGMGAPSFLLAPSGLVRAGHRVVLLMPAGEGLPGRSEFEGIELQRYAGFPRGVLEDASEGRVRRFVQRVATYRRYRRATRREGLALAAEIRPDVVIGYDDYGVPVARDVARRLGVPNVSRFFGTYMLPYVDNPMKLYYHFVPAIAYATPAAYAIINDDGSGGDRVARRLGVPPERIRFWRNGVDHGTYWEDPREVRAARERLRVELGLPVSAKLLFTMSRLVREKHVERIVRAMPAVLAAHPDASFLVFGEGPERARIEAEVVALGVGQAVRMLGAIARRDLPAYINACDLFVAASDRTNGANPTYEAMICARPVVVLDTGRTRDVVEDGVTGFTVAEPAGLGAAIAAALGDEERAREVGARARAWALAHLVTLEERQQMEVALIEQAVREARAG